MFLYFMCLYLMWVYLMFDMRAFDVCAFDMCVHVYLMSDVRASTFYFRLLDYYYFILNMIVLSLHCYFIRYINSPGF